jgi:RimJ/RimL family protein N-acetyltransferase
MTRMSHTRIRTKRLELVAVTEPLAAAENTDHPVFARLLGVLTPERWPPPLNDADSMRWAWDHAKKHPGGEGFGMWYVVLPVESGTGGGPDGSRGVEGDIGKRLVIGTCGFRGLPSDDGTVETGYSVLEEHQGKGYATELVGALVRWAFADPRVTRIVGETFPDMTPSRRVLEKCGFTLRGQAAEPGAVRYELTRGEWAAGSRV